MSVAAPDRPVSGSLFSRRLRKFAPFLTVAGTFYATWLTYVTLSGSWSTVIDNWPIAFAMALGSFVAGSTPMGGGTVGFPVLVLGFDFPATLGRDFSFAIQSIGMVSASLFILNRRQPLEWVMLRSGFVGSAIGTPLGLLYIAPYVSGLLIKVAFAVLWASFGLLHLLKVKDLVRLVGILPTAATFDRVSGFSVGLFGGALVSSITGVGVDMLIYVVLVLLCRADLKIAIPTSVLLMAFTSLVGLVTQTATDQMQPGVFSHWLAAAPVVAVGAPLGSLIVDRIDRSYTLVFVSLLCVAQFVWTMQHEASGLGAIGITLSVLAIVVANALFLLLYRVGANLSRR